MVYSTTSDGRNVVSLPRVEPSLIKLYYILPNASATQTFLISYFKTPSAILALVTQAKLTTTLIIAQDNRKKGICSR